ncbi:hypothetical protein L5M18_22340 [Shewanella sp. SM20]|uniref:hypothetical protein n=1 Tax=Shewanella sp. SM20 TaxID=2912792 RepID=UPI0021DA582A|nr:hypothetical protein [Shewanella sp. SM20]MCU8094248.1 hypothetical protein [Shewanella sp. SM20]
MTDNHGGLRKGAGRPKGTKTAEPDKMVRVPLGCLDDVKALISRYKTASIESDGQTDWIGKKGIIKP